MGACGCGRSAYEQILKDFWNGLPIRSMTPREYEVIVNKVYGKSDLKVDTNFELHIIDNCLKNSDYLKTSAELFNAAKNDLCENETQMLTCITFLTMKDINQAKQSMTKMSTLFKNNLIFEEKKIRFFHRENLMKIVRIYVNLITNFCVPFLYKHVKDEDNKKDMELFLAEMYAEVQREKFVAQLFEDSFHNADNNLSVDYFFDFIYTALADDTYVRDRLFKMWQDDQDKKEKENVGSGLETKKSAVQVS